MPQPEADKSCQSLDHSWVLHVWEISARRENQLPKLGLVSGLSCGGAWKTNDTLQQLLFLRGETSLTQVRWDLSSTPLWRWKAKVEHCWVPGLSLTPGPTAPTAQHLGVPCLGFGT